MKKYLAFLALITLLSLPVVGQDNDKTTNIQWDKELEVKTGEVSFNDGSYYAYTIEIYDTDDRFVQKLWKEQMKNISEKVKRNVAYNALLSIYEEPVDMHVKIEENKKSKSSSVTQSAAFLHNGTPINPDDYPEAHRKAKEMMYDMAVQMNKAAANERIENADKDLAKMQKELEKLRKANDKLHSTIVQNQKRLEKAERDEEKLTADIADQEKEIERFEARTEGERSLKDLKKLDKMQKHLRRLKDRLNRAQSNQIKYEQNIRKAEEEIPLNEQEQTAKEKEIAAQQEKMNQLQTMYREIN